MYQPRKHIRLDPIDRLPTLDELKNLLARAQSSVGVIIELPWQSKRTGRSLSLTARIELGGIEPLWTLFEGREPNCRVLWSVAFKDVYLLHDVLVSSLPNEEKVVEVEIPNPDMSPQAMPNHPAAPYSTLRSNPSYTAPYVHPASEQHAASPPVHSLQPVPNQPYPNYATPPSANDGAAGHIGVPPTQVDMTPNMMQGRQSWKSTLTSSAELDLLSKRPNILLGKFLLDADLIPQHTLDAALVLQDMVKSGALDTSQAAQALARAHNRSGAFETNIFLAKPNPDARDWAIVAPPLGQILLEAGLINVEALKLALSLQEAVRTGVMTSDEGLSVFAHECFGKPRSPANQDTPEVERAINLLRFAGMLQPQDIQAAEAIQRKHGGELMKILVTAGKLDELTMEAAIRCQYLVHQQKVKTEQAVIALHYCQRSRVTFDDAVEELGWNQQ